jgi:hypothetical protein
MNVVQGEVEVIRITVQLLPYGSDAQARTIAVGTIINDGTGSTKQGNYNADFILDNGTVLTSSIMAFNRQQSIWQLILAALSNVRKFTNNQEVPHASLPSYSDLNQ